MDLIVTPRVSLPIARDHIERAARRSGVPGYQIDATVRCRRIWVGISPRAATRLSYRPKAPPG